MNLGRVPPLLEGDAGAGTKLQPILVPQPDVRHTAGSVASLSGDV